jgi:hypothetical protein
MLTGAAPMDHSDVRMVANLVARLAPAQQRVVVAVADGFRAGWLDEREWERCWRHGDFANEYVLRDVMTWLVRRHGRMVVEAV